MSRTRQPLSSQSRPQTTTEIHDSNTLRVSRTLRLRGEDISSTSADPSPARHIRWSEDVVDNEGMGKKSSKDPWARAVPNRSRRIPARRIRTATTTSALARTEQIAHITHTLVGEAHHLDGHQKGARTRVPMLVVQNIINRRARKGSRAQMHTRKCLNRLKAIRKAPEAKEIYESQAAWLLDSTLHSIVSACSHPTPGDSRY
ncbi:hypothetical protein N7510_011702 [Penicillium lagena]|uniref:uncharacterized protein n=1 Tax=Penicillium lagena TaxID=94218 RepID=UPI002541F154|nr:uncharacterized protein N7510_011702 [Penicillium lagena]KAJ5602168.1 hypothetical protein N7510_011702 [Penicillium lagena]